MGQSVSGFLRPVIKIRKNHREIGLANERKPMPPVIPRRSPHTMTKKPDSHKVQTVRVLSSNYIGV